MLGGMGPWELMIILAIVVVLFGAKRLPMIGDGLGKMIHNFRSATKKEDSEETHVKKEAIENKEPSVINVTQTADQTEKESA